MSLLALLEAPAVSPALVYLAGLDPRDSRRSQTSALRRLAGWLVGPGARPELVPWHLVRYEHVVALRARMVAARLAPRTINRHLGALRGVAREAWRLGQLDAESLARLQDVETIPVPRLPSGRHVPAEDVRAAFLAANPRDRAVLALLYGAGLRRREACEVELRDLDETTGRLAVREGKGRRDRAAALPPAALCAVAAWLDVRGRWAGPILCGFARGVVAFHGLTPGTIRDRMNAISHVANLGTRLRAHDFRRTFATDLLTAGTDLATVQRLMGHADPRTTSRYDLRPEESDRAGAARLPFPSG